MNCIVCVKQVPDTETRIKVAADQRSIEETGINWVVNPFDEYAVEAALRLREAAGGGKVTVLCQGDDRALTALRTCLAMGADQAVLIKDLAAEGSDSLGVARLLAAAARTMDFDLILLGKMGVGADNHQVGPMLAELLGLPHVGTAVQLEVGDGQAVARRQVEGATEVFRSSLPAVITAEKGLNEPRYPSLKGIMAAKKKEIEVRDCRALGIDPASVGRAGAKVVQTKLELPPARPAGRIIGGEPREAVRELLRLLREEVKAI